MPDWSRFDRADVKTFSLAATKDEADRVLSVSDAGDYTFYVIFDRALGTTDDYLLTVDADGTSYGVRSLGSKRKPTDTKLYFTLTSGAQVDFVDRKKKTSDETAKLDLATYEGRLVFAVWRTDPQQDGVWPTGRVLLRRQTIEVTQDD